MLSEGWNRKTLEASLERLVELGLVRIEAYRFFPRFGRNYSLTESGEYVACFVKHLERQVKSTLGIRFADFCELPKGCMAILVSMNRRGYEGISRILEKLDMSPHQAYRCLDSMEECKILLKEELSRGKKQVTSYSLSEDGLHVAVAVDALDRALEGSLDLGRASV